MLGNRPMSDWVAQYSSSHQHPVNRLCHTFGIPMIVVAILMAFAGFVTPSLWIPAAIIFVIGWVLQFIGHYFEGEPPEFFKDWRFLFVGLRWWLAKMSGRTPFDPEGASSAGSRELPRPPRTGNRQSPGEQVTD